MTALMVGVLVVLAIVIAQPDWLPPFLKFEAPNEYMPREVMYGNDDAVADTGSSAVNEEDKAEFLTPKQNPEPRSEMNNEVKMMTIRPEMDMISDQISKTPSRLTGETNGVLRLFRSNMASSKQFRETAPKNDKDFGENGGNMMMFSRMGAELNNFPTIKEEDEFEE